MQGGLRLCGAAHIQPYKEHDECMLRNALESTCEVPRFCVGSENQEENSPSLSELEQHPCMLRDSLESTYENPIFCVCSENQGEDGLSLSEFALYMELA
jgi:hypothetical protein